ncbi:MAG: hypothetical protein OHK0021_17430 [Bryobacter sp.]
MNILGWFRRATPEEKERARCALLRQTGRRVEGEIIEAEGSVVVYEYEIRSVSYQATQDLRLTGGTVPADTMSLLGPATVQYDRKNPVNSMVVFDRPVIDGHGDEQRKESTTEIMKNAMMALALAAVMLTAPAVAANKPKTVVHVINVKFKASAAKADVDKAIEGIYSIVGKNKGVKNVWLRPIKVQGGAAGFTHCLVMEFESEAALKAYSGSDEQKEWYKLWEPVRELSNTHDVTN